MKKREPEQLRQASPGRLPNPEPAQPVRQTTLRQQQLDEEATALPLNTNDALTQLVGGSAWQSIEAAQWGTTMIGWLLFFLLCR